MSESRPADAFARLRAQERRERDGHVGRQAHVQGQELPHAQKQQHARKAMRPPACGRGTP